jgi:DNA polymerase-3 subunit beta
MITIKAGHLADALGKSVADRRNTIPVLGTAMVDASGGVVITTNLEQSMTSRVVMGGAGRLLLPIEQALGFASRMGREDDITIALDGSMVRMSCGRSRAAAGALAPEAFPTIVGPGEVTTIEMDGAALLAAIGRVESCISREETRYYLQGVHMTISGGMMRLEATDGHRAAIQQLAVDGEVDDIIIPHDALAPLKKMAVGPLKIEIGRSSVAFSTSAATLRTKLIEGTFPELDPVMIREGIRCEVRSADLISAVALVSTTTEGRETPARFTVASDRMTIEGVASGTGAVFGATEISCACIEDFVGALKLRYLTEMVKEISTSATLVFTSNMWGIVDNDDPNFLGVIMGFRT